MYRKAKFKELINRYQHHKHINWTKPVMSYWRAQHIKIFELLDFYFSLGTDATEKLFH